MTDVKHPMYFLFPLSGEGINPLKPKKYNNKLERMQAMEDILLELCKLRDSNGVRVHTPFVYEIANIYRQAEEANT